MPSAAATRALLILWSGLFGLAVGSFLNVVAYRVPRGLSILRPASHCPACTTPLGPFETVPVVSWLALRGRCRHCSGPISGRYALVELTTGACFAGLAAALGSPDALAPLAVVTACAVGSSVVDADGARVPTMLVAAAAVGAASLAVVSAVVAAPDRIAWAALGALLAGACAWAVDRSGDEGRWRAPAVVAALGCCAGWTWPGGGPLVAGWVAVAGAAAVVGSTRRAPLGLLAAGAFCVIIAGSALGGS